MLKALRLQQLVDLARAYEILLPEGATKKEVLPPMIAAEQRGMFRQQPKHPWYLKKAHRTSDIPYVDIGENPEIEEAVVEHVEVASRTITTKARNPTAPRKQSDYHRKQQALKLKGINAFGMTKQAVNELAEEHGIS